MRFWLADIAPSNEGIITVMLCWHVGLIAAFNALRDLRLIAILLSSLFLVRLVV